VALATERVRAAHLLQTAGTTGFRLLVELSPEHLVQIALRVTEILGDARHIRSASPALGCGGIGVDQGDPEAVSFIAGVTQGAPLMSMQIPVVGRRFLFDFGENAKYDLDFEDAHTLTVTVVADPAYPAGTVNQFEVQRTEIRPNVYMVTWTEPDTGNTVVHVQDFDAEIAYTNITDLASKRFWNLKGQITSAGPAGGYPGLDPALAEDAAREATETPGMG
jgi:hypothetical protein